MITDPNGPAHYEIIKNIILILREKIGDDFRLISGMAEGFDEAIAKVGMREGIPYIAAVPHPTYGEYYWGKKSKTGKNRMPMFAELLACADEVVFVSKTLYVNGVHANFVRNQWMVDHANFSLVYNAKSSGTRDCVARLTAANIGFIEFPFREQLKLDI